PTSVRSGDRWRDKGQGRRARQRERNSAHPACAQRFFQPATSSLVLVDAFQRRTLLRGPEIQPAGSNGLTAGLHAATFAKKGDAAWDDWKARQRSWSALVRSDPAGATARQPPLPLRARARRSYAS